MNLKHLRAFAAHMKGDYSEAEKLARATHMVRAMKRSKGDGDTVPYRSKAQVRYMHAEHPQIAARWDDKYGVPQNLPEHVPGKGKEKAEAAKQALAAFKRNYG